MPLIIAPKSELSTSHLNWIKDRLLAPEHAGDCGPPKVWDTYQHGLYAAIDVGSNKVVGLIEASGPKDSVNPGWWLDSTVRKQGYGKMLVDALASYLKSDGYIGVGRITIQTNGGVYDSASEALARRFRAHFQCT